MLKAGKSLNSSKTSHVLSTVRQITSEPSIIAKFAISLAQAFNKYYAHTRILDESPERDSRLALSYATAVVVLKEAPEEFSFALE